MKSIIFFLFIALPFSVLAQSNYYPGYILTNNGDTLKGFINYHEWTKSPHSIDFKVKKDDKTEQKFSPQTIKAFQITGFENYTSYTGFVSNGKTAILNLSKGVDTGKTADTVFLRQLVTGRYLTLFYESDDVKTRYFISEPNEAPVELNYYEYINEASELTKSAIYKGQLILYVNKFRSANDKLVQKIEQISYDQEDLKNIVNDINESKSIGSKGLSKRFFAGIGINYNTTESSNTLLKSGKQISTSVFPQISAGIDIFGNPNIQQLIFRAELSFSYIDPKFAVKQVNGFAYGPFSFNQYTGTLTPQLILNVFNKDRIKIYVDAGLGLNLSGYSNSKLIIEEIPYTLNSFWVNLPVQAGIVFNKKMEIYFTFNGYAAYTGYDFFYVRNRTAAAGVKFLFGK